MIYDLVISGGTLVNNDTLIKADLGISGKKIAELGSNLSGREYLDATSKLVIPGAIDPHVHLEMPTPAATSSDTWFTGTRAAACGGTTTVIDFIDPRPDESLRKAFDNRRSLAEGQAVIDFGLHMTIDRVDDNTLKEIPEMVAAGLTSFKCYTTYAMQLNDHQLLTALEKISISRGLTIIHAENDTIINHLRRFYVEAGLIAPKFHPLCRPAAAEGEAVERILALAEIANSPVYVVHVSTRRGVEAIARAQERDQAAFGETCPQYLVLTDACYDIPGFEGAKFVCSPPLRKTDDQDALWQALSDRILQAIGTDHCPFFYHGTKNLGRPLDDPPPFTQIPGGMPGIESRLALLYTFGVRTGRIDLSRWVNVCSTGPARMFGLYPQKGCLQVGADADIVIFDPEKQVTLSSDFLHENVDYTPYEGMALIGYPVTTLSQGRVIVENMEYVGGNPQGSFIARSPFESIR